MFSIKTVLIGLFFLVFASTANAIPVSFDVDGVKSGAEITSLTTIGSADADLSLVDGVGDVIFDLDVGESYSFDFFEVDLSGVGGVAGTVAATLFFDTPGGSASATGSGWAVTVGGWLSGGVLTWDSVLPNPVVLANGTSYSVEFEDLTGLTFGSSIVGQATVTLLSAASVPEPGALALLGLGILGLGVSRRRTTVQSQQAR